MKKTPVIGKKTKTLDEEDAGDREEDEDSWAVA